MHRTILMIWLLLTVVDAEAQVPAPTTSKVDIVLTLGDCKTLPSEVQVVFNGDDRDRFTVKQDAANPCHYAGPRPEGPYTIGQQTFSLRLGVARTDCRVTSEMVEKEPPRFSIGRLIFPFKPNTAQDLTITTNPRKFIVSYVREYRRDTTLKGSRDCRELADFEAEEKLLDVMFDRETIQVRFAVQGEKALPWGIFIDGVIQEELQSETKKRMLEPTAIGAAYKRQNGTGQLPDATLHPSANAANAIAEGLRKKGLKNVTLEQE